MATSILEQRIQATKSKLSQLEARLTLIDGRKAAVLRSRRRKDDLRRKILAGAWVLTRRRDLLPEVLSYLERPEDRALFVAPEVRS